MNGKQGSFPSSYVEKLSRPVLAPKPAAKKPYKPFGAALRGTESPAPGGVNSLGLQEGETVDMKAKFNQYKSSVKDFGAGKLSV